MSYQKLVDAIQQLSTSEKLALLEVLARSLRNKVQPHTGSSSSVRRVRGMLKQDAFNPSDKEFPSNFQAINFREKLDLFTELWSPKIIAQMNNFQFKLVKIQGEFVWHSHAETDEVFIVLAGEMAIEFRNGRIHLHPGELFVVPKGVEHKPIAENECHILLVEPAGLVNTGDADSNLTAPNDVWI